MNKSEIELKLSTTKFPFEYKFFEWCLIINQELYDNQIIDLHIFQIRENSILKQIEKIKNNFSQLIRR